MAAETGKLISVIVPAWNSAGCIERCLRALSDQSLANARYEIIVVDNGSTDDTAALAGSFENVSLIKEPRAGSYIARNTGARVAKGRYLAFTDSDCRPDRNWLSAAKAYLDEDAGVLVGPIKLFDETADGRRLCRDYEEMFSFPQDVSKGNCATANWVCSKAMFEKLGGFDETMKSGADKEMTLRMQSSGKRLQFVPDMIVYHPIRATMGAVLNKRRRLAGGRWSRAKGRFRSMRCIGGFLTEAVHRLRRVVQAEHPNFPRRAMLGALVVWIAFVSIFETLRLDLGGKPVR